MSAYPFMQKAGGSRRVQWHEMACLATGWKLSDLDCTQLGSSRVQSLQKSNQLLFGSAGGIMHEQQCGPNLIKIMKASQTRRGLGGCSRVQNVYIHMQYVEEGQRYGKSLQSWTLINKFYKPTLPMSQSCQRGWDRGEEKKSGVWINGKALCFVQTCFSVVLHQPICLI